MLEEYGLLYLQHHRASQPEGSVMNDLKSGTASSERRMTSLDQFNLQAGLDHRVYEQRQS